MFSVKEQCSWIVLSVTYLYGILIYKEAMPLRFYQFKNNVVGYLSL